MTFSTDELDVILNCLLAGSDLTEERFEKSRLGLIRRVRSAIRDRQKRAHQKPTRLDLLEPKIDVAGRTGCKQRFRLEMLVDWPKRVGS